MAEARIVSRFTRGERGRLVRNNDSGSSESQDESGTPRRQREAMRIKYTQRRRRLRRKKVEKTQASSSDSESNSEKKSFELVGLRKQQFGSQNWMREGTFLAKPKIVDDISTFDARSLCGDVMTADSLSDLWDDEGSIQCSTKSKTSNWYSDLFGSIFGSLSHVASYIFSNKMSPIAEKEDFDLDFQQDFEGNVGEMAKKVLDRVIQFCPHQYEEELQLRCIHPLRYKLNQRGVTIGICGQSQFCKKSVMKLIERRASDIGNVSCRLCLNPSKESFEDVTMSCLEWKQDYTDMISELATCAAYIYVLSDDDQSGCRDGMDSLQWLFERDKDVVTQGRLLLLVNKSSANVSHTPPLTCLNPLPNDAQSIHHTTQYRIQSPDTVTTQIQASIHERVGIHIPRNYIFPCVLRADQLPSEGILVEQRDQAMFIEDGCKQPEVSVNHQFSSRTEDEQVSTSEDERKESLKNEVVRIQSWLKQTSQNCEVLCQLSIISDALYCIQYCSDRLQNSLEWVSRDIDKLEGLVAHQNHLMAEMKQLWTHLEVKTKDVGLYNEMIISYEEDIKGSVRTVRDCAHDVLERFQAVCVSKLEKLALKHEQSKFHNIRDILYLFKTDIESFTSEIIKCVDLVNGNLLFLNMLNTLQQKCSYSELQEIQELAQACLMAGLTDEANISSDMLEFEDPKLISPCSLETIGCRTSLNAIQISDLLYSILMTLAFKNCGKEEMNKSDLRKQRGDFKDLCSHYLQSSIVRQKSVQYHMEMIARLFFKHLDTFKQHFLPQFKHKNHQLECRLADTKSEYQTLELQFKHLINLKVHLEVKKSSFFLHND